MILFNLTVFDLEEFNDGHGLGRLNNGVNQLDCRSIDIRCRILLDFANVGSSRKCRFRHGNLTPGRIDYLRAEHFELLALDVPVNLEARNPRNGHVSAARSSSARFSSRRCGDLRCHQRGQIHADIHSRSALAVQLFKIHLQTSNLVARLPRTLSGSTRCISTRTKNNPSRDNL